MMTNFTVTPGLVLERVGEDVLVMTPGRADVIRLTAEQQHVLQQIIAGKKVGVSGVTEQLVDLGLVTAKSGITRRGVLSAGAVGAGFAVLSLPTAALASSKPQGSSDNGGSGGGDDSAEEYWRSCDRRNGGYSNSPLEVDLLVEDFKVTEVSRLTLVSYDNSDFDAPHNVSGEPTFDPDGYVDEGQTYITWEFGKPAPPGDSATGWIGVATINDVCYQIVLG